MAVSVERNKSGLSALEKQKNAFAKKVMSVKDENTISLLLSYYQELITAKRITKAQYNREIEEAEKRVKAGKFLPNEQVIKEMRRW